MLYLLLGWFIVLFFISYYLTGKDFFTPATMMMLSFVFACSLSVYILFDLDYSFSLQTTLLIGSCMTITVIIGWFCHGVFQHVRIRPAQDKASPIPRGFTILALFVAVIVIFAQLREITRVVGTSGMFGQTMILYRNAHGYSTNVDAQYPLWLRLMLNFLQALVILYLFNLIKFFRTFKVHEIVLQVAFLILMVLSGLLTSGRFSILSNMIGGVFLFHMIRIQRLGKYKTYKLGFLMRVMLIVVAAAWFFYWVKEFVGRVSEDTLFDYTAHYMGTGIINLDLYLNNPPVKSDIWGKETFYSLINALRRSGIVNIESYLFHKEFRSIFGISTGNIYTAIRDYHYDFGVIGVYALHILFSFIYTIFYEYIKKKGGSFSIIIFSQTYYCTVLYMYNNFFYSNLVSFGFVFRIIITYILYKFATEKQIRLRIVRGKRRLQAYARDPANARLI